jgi:hypothetical protein
MGNKGIIRLPEIRPHISVEVKEELLASTQETGQVIVHCSYTADNQECGIRIWKSTYLVAHEVDHQSELLNSFNITLSPEWTMLDPFQTQEFTLIFSGLPDECKTFDLVEKISEQMPFHVRNIRRNENDVYRIVLS